MGSYKKVVYNCKQATFLIEKKVEKELLIKEKIQLFIHLRGCDVCKIYRKQSKMINIMVSHLLKDAQKQHPKLDEDFKKKLQLRIEDELNKN